MKKYQIKQFEDKGLSHFSYAVLADRKVILIDPARDPQLYYDFAATNEAEIIGVIETHPHADFVSSHYEIHKAVGAAIYVSEMVGADYPFEAFDEGDEKCQRLVCVAPAICFSKLHGNLPSLIRGAG